MYPKELLPYITTFAGNAGIGAGGTVVVAPATTQDRWLLAVQVAEDDGVLGVALRLENAALAAFVCIGYRFCSLCAPICRLIQPSVTGGNNLTWRNLNGAAGTTIAWTVVVADAPAGILGGASETIINNRQGWGGT
jgi:hypothetical protein